MYIIQGGVETIRRFKFADIFVDSARYTSLDKAV